MTPGTLARFGVRSDRARAARTQQRAGPAAPAAQGARSPARAPGEHSAATDADGWVRRHCARVLDLSTRDPERSVREARRGLARAKALTRAERGLLERSLGHALRSVGDYAQARAAYRRAQGHFRRAGLGLERAVCALGLVDACMYLGRTAEALRAAAHARRVFEERDEKLRLAKLETNIGNLHHRVEALHKALEHYERAALLFGTSGTPAERARVDYNRANILAHLGHVCEAQRLFRNSREALEGAGEDVLAAQALYGLACLRFLSGEYAAAMADLESVRRTLANLGARPLLALADLDLSEVLMTLRLYPEALALSRSAIRWFRRRAMPAEQARCELVAGSALIPMGRLGTAGLSLARAERLFRSQRHRPGMAMTALSRARWLQSAGRPPQAAREALRARAILEDLDFKVRAKAAAAFAAEALLDAGEEGRASSLAQRELAAPREAGDAISRARLARVAARVAAERGDLAGSARDYRQALSEMDRAKAALFVDEWRLGFLDGEPALLEEFLGTRLKRRPRPTPAAIWRWLAQSARARTRRRASSDAAGEREVQGAAMRLRADLQACYAHLWQLRSDGTRKAEPATTRALERRTLRLERAVSRLARPPYHLHAHPESGKVEPLPSSDPGLQRIVYFCAGDSIGAIGSGPDRWRLLTDLAPLDIVQEHLRLLHHQMDARGSDLPALRAHRSTIEARSSEHLAALGRHLIEPVLRGYASAPERIRVTPHGPLFRVPFHALVWRGAPLVQVSEVSLEPFAGWVEPEAGRPREGACVVGRGAEPGDPIEVEAAWVASQLASAGVATRSHVGREATLAAVQEISERCALLHLAGHSVYRVEHPEFSSVRLADCWLSVGDIARLPLAGATVVLSSCETGPRGAVAGTEVLGLVRGFLQAGCAAVVASLWRVDDRATLDFMRGLYDQWRRIGRLGPALSEAQRRLVAQGKTPYLWAPFILAGHPDVPWPQRDPQGRFPLTERSGVP